MSEVRVVKKKVLYVNNAFNNLDNIHYDIENISLIDEITLVNEKLVELQEHLVKQQNKIKRRECFDCRKVEELPREIVKLIESFMSDDIDTICKAWCIRGLYINSCVFQYAYLERPWEVQYIHHIFKKYKRKKLWDFMTNHKVVLDDDWAKYKSQPKYFLIDIIYKAIRIDDFDWNKSLSSQPKYHTKINRWTNAIERPLDIEYQTYQILKIVSTSPQPLT